MESPKGRLKDVFSKKLLYETLICGGLSGAISEVCCFPIDVLALRMKVSLGKPQTVSKLVMSIVKKEGVPALFSGVDVVLLASIPSKALFFVGYEGVKNIGHVLFHDRAQPAIHFVAGMISEIFSSMIYVPEEVIKSRMMLGKLTDRNWMVDNSRYKTSIHATREILRAEGIRGLYSGYFSCILTDCCNSGFQVLFYELIRSNWIRYRSHHFQNTKSNSPGVVEEVVIAGVSGVLSTCLSNPLDLITCRLMVQDRSGAKPYSGILDVIRKVYKREGLLAFYKGLLPRMMYVSPLVAIQYAGYQWFKKMSV